MQVPKLPRDLNGVGFAGLVKQLGVQGERLAGFDVAAEDDEGAGEVSEQAVRLEGVRQGAVHDLAIETRPRSASSRLVRPAQGSLTSTTSLAPSFGEPELLQASATSSKKIRYWELTSPALGRTVERLIRASCAALLVEASVQVLWSAMTLRNERCTITAFVGRKFGDQSAERLTYCRCVV